MSGAKRGDYQNCSVLYCVLNLCTVISTLRWAVLTILWIGFCYTGPISLCVDWFVFICVYFVCICFILHSCCIIVSTVEWTWWDWSLILRTFPSVLWHYWLGHLICKNSDTIYDVFCGTLNLALSILSKMQRIPEMSLAEISRSISFNLKENNEKSCKLTAFEDAKVKSWEFLSSHEVCFICCTFMFKLRFFILSNNQRDDDDDDDDAWR